MASVNTTMVATMKEAGSMIKDMGRDTNDSVMEMSIREILKMEKLLVKAFTNGLMVTHMMGSGTMGRKMGMEFGRVTMAIAT